MGRNRGLANGPPAHWTLAAASHTLVVYRRRSGVYLTVVRRGALLLGRGPSVESEVTFAQPGAKEEPPTVTETHRARRPGTWRAPARTAAALCVVLSASVVLSARGGSGAIPGDAVVQVGSQPITNATFTHWLGVAASASAQTATGTAGSEPVVPDPPSYSKCVAHLQAAASKPAKGKPPPTVAQSTAKCEQQYTALKQQVLGFLISSDWVIGEASDQGIKVSDQEVEQKFTELKKRQFPKEEAFRKFLASTGQSVPDLLLRVKLNILSQKVRQKIAKTGTVTQAQIKKYYDENKARFTVPATQGRAASQQTLAQVKEPIEQRLQTQGHRQALTKFVAEYRKKWEAGTDCRPGYVVRDCRQFKAPKTPAFPATTAPAATTTK